MKTVFSYFALFCASAVLCATVSTAAARLLKELAFREVTRPEARRSIRPRASRPRLIWMAVACLAVAVLGSGILTGRPIFGLLVLALFPAVFPRVARGQRAKLSRDLGRSSLSYLYALRGLIRAGVSLPSALFHLSDRVPAPFAATLRGFLGSFEGGKSLQTCLSRFRIRSDPEGLGTALALLEMAYRNGLPVGPLLDRVLPILEAEERNRERIRSLRHSTWVQVGMAVLLPWGLGSVFHYFQPEVLEHFRNSSFFVPSLAVALSFEGIGGLMVWRISSFY